MKRKVDRLMEMADLILQIVKDEEYLDIDIKSFIVDMAHTFNLRKKDIDINNDELIIILEIHNRGYYIARCGGDVFTIFDK